MTTRALDRSTKDARRASQARVLTAYSWALASVIVTTALSVAGRDVLALPDIVMIYLLGIMVVAARFGRWPSTFAAALSVASYDFFIVPPIFKFVVDDVRHILTFTMMFGVGLVVSHLTDRLRRQELRAHEEELRSTLLSTVSHDLRSPLAVITGAATTLRDDPAQLSSDERLRLAEAICGEANRLDRLIENLLDMTRLQFGGVQVRKLWVSLDDVVASALGRVAPLLAGRAVSTQLPDGVLLVSVDRALLEQLFVNLFENAAKYTPKGSPIDLVALRTDAAWEIEVADRGPGVDASLREKVFEKFYRGPNEDSPGAGLGLSICRGIAEAHGGSLTLHARPGGGSVFRIVLPSPHDSQALTREPLGVPGMEGRS